MRKRESIAEIQNRLVFALKAKSAKAIAKIERALRDAQRNGIMLAADVATDYDRYNSHPYLVSDCIRGKLNAMKGKPRKNPHADTLNNAVSRLADKVESVEGTMRFLVRVYKMPTPGDRMWRLRPDEFHALKAAVPFLRKHKTRHSGAARAVAFIDALIREQAKANSCGSTKSRR